MKCPACKSYVEPELDWKCLVTMMVLALLMGFFGGIFFYEWKMVPKFEKKIERTQQLNEELKKGSFVPPRKEGTH